MYYVYQQQLFQILSLIDDQGLYPMLKEQIVQNPFFDLEDTLTAIEEYRTQNPQVSDTLNQLKSDLKLEMYIGKMLDHLVGNNLSLSQWILDLNALIYGPIDTESYLEQQLQLWCKRLNDKINWQSSPLELYDTMNRYVAEGFVIETDPNPQTLNFYSIFQTQKISPVALSLLYLMIAERIQLPIFGLPQQDNLLLIMARAHCNDSELVYLDDIIFYFLPGPNGIVYTLKELEWLGASSNQNMQKTEKLPKCNRILAHFWLTQVNEMCSKNMVNKQLNIKIQQVIKMLKDVG